MFNLSSPVTGGTLSGLVDPTFTVVADIAPSVYAKQFAVTALGGTQVGSQSHTVALPFTITATRAAQLKQISYNFNGTIKSIPNNVHKLLIRKGVTCGTGISRVASFEMIMTVPAGSENNTNGQAQLDSMYSAAIGVLQQQLQGLRSIATVGLI